MTEQFVQYVSILGVMTLATLLLNARLTTLENKLDQINKQIEELKELHN